MCDFSCSIQNISLPLHREPALEMSAHQRRRVADIIKKRLLRGPHNFKQWGVLSACFGYQKTGNFRQPKTRRQ